MRSLRGITGEIRMITKSKDLEQQAIEHVGALMCAAARTAPKAHGADNLSTLMVTGKEKDALAKEMMRIAKKHD